MICWRPTTMPSCWKTKITESASTTPVFRPAALCGRFSFGTPVGKKPRSASQVSGRQLGQSAANPCVSHLLMHRIADRVGAPPMDWRIDSPPRRTNSTDAPSSCESFAPRRRAGADRPMRASTQRVSNRSGKRSAAKKVRANSRIWTCAAPKPAKRCGPKKASVYSADGVLMTTRRTAAQRQAMSGTKAAL